MIGAALIVIVFALFCCGIALWTVLGDHDLRAKKTNPYPGLTEDAMRVIKKANGRRWVR